MADRVLDFRMKGLSIEVRQRLFMYMKNEISDMMIKSFLEKETGYKIFHSMGFSEDQIELIGESYAPKFEHANEIMAEQGRPPLFSNPHDSFLSAREYREIMKLRSKEELLELFACTYQEYVPTVLSPEDAAD